MSWGQEWLKYASLSAVLLGSAAVHAEGVKLRGTVLEKGERKPIFGAEVFVVDNDALSTSSNEKGEFELTVPVAGNYLLRAVAVGYGRAIPLSVTVPQDGAPAVIYLQANFTLPAVTVRAERHPSRVAKSVMTGDEVRNVPGTGGDPLKAIQTLPGVAVGSDMQSAPAIRGSRPEDNIYYVDALPVSYLFHMGGIVSVLNADLIDSFNLYAAAFGPEYGDVTGAVLDVTLRNPRTDRFGAKLNLSFIGVDALVEGPVTDTQSFFLSARRSNLGPVVKSISKDKKGETLEVPRYYDYQGKYVWQLDEGNTLTAHMSGAADEMASVLTGASDRVRKEPDLLGRTLFDQSYDAQALTWEAHSALGGHNKLAFGHQRTTSDTSVGAAGYANYIGNTRYLREQWRYSAIPAHALLAGASMLNVRTELDLDIKNPLCGGQKTTPDCDLSSAPRLQLKDTITANFWELYVSDRWRVAPQWILAGGLRWSHDDYLDESFTEPRVALEWDAAEGRVLTVGWGEHHQFPRGEQVIDKFGNPNLSHIRAQHRVLGIEQRFASVWSAKLAGYYKTFDKLVLADPSVNYRNGGSGRAYGVETLIKKDTQGPWSGWLALSLSDSQRRNDLTGETFQYDFDQPVNATVVLNYKHSEYWSFGAKWTYHSGNPYTPIFGPKAAEINKPVLPRYDDLNSGRLPAYHRLDLRADRHYLFDTWKLNAYLELINAYNRKNVATYDYDISYTQRKATYQLPLIPSFGVQGEF